MKRTRTLTTAACAVLAIAAVGTLPAADLATSAPMPAVSHATARARPFRQFLRALHQVNLSDAQRQQVKALLASARSATKAHDAPDLSALANPGDPNYASALQSAKDRAVTRIERWSGLQTQIYGVLTVEQKAQLTQVLGRFAALSEGYAARGTAASYAVGAAAL